ncbi:hypothetical protein NEHOM01_0372 [Nematocida homosporus]|uniref:uncharacterized protein n=1 Tax=Nematocida homosporus TaxID=1912981 RepID=UPI00221EB0A7|nr:uncharacterized protein NEHOM01_0372 [Nematocida homosporus]KAI5184770.1 hypothetical protein NEHOM01_0372 [Nematocida homosporus]
MFPSDRTTSPCLSKSNSDLPLSGKSDDPISCYLARSKTSEEIGLSLSDQKRNGKFDHSRVSRGFSSVDLNGNDRVGSNKGSCLSKELGSGGKSSVGSVVSLGSLGHLNEVAGIITNPIQAQSRPEDEDEKLINKIFDKTNQKLINKKNVGSTRPANSKSKQKSSQGGPSSSPSHLSLPHITVLPSTRSGPLNSSKRSNSSPPSNPMSSSSPASTKAPTVHSKPTQPKVLTSNSKQSTTSGQITSSSMVKPRSKAKAKSSTTQPNLATSRPSQQHQSESATLSVTPSTSSSLETVLTRYVQANYILQKKKFVFLQVVTIEPVLAKTQFKQCIYKRLLKSETGLYTWVNRHTLVFAVQRSVLESLLPRLLAFGSVEIKPNPLLQTKYTPAQMLNLIKTTARSDAAFWKETPSFIGKLAQDITQTTSLLSFYQCIDIEESDYEGLGPITTALLEAYRSAQALNQPVPKPTTPS